jgi:hypothetical protein
LLVLYTGKLGSDPIFTRADIGVWGKSHQLRPMLEASKRAKIQSEILFHSKKPDPISALI